MNERVYRCGQHDRERWRTGQRSKSMPVPDQRLAQWVSNGELRFEEKVFDGIECASESSPEHFRGRNFCKPLVRIVDR